MNIEQIAEQVARDFKMGFDGIELDFALEVAKRTVAAEREACAKVCEEKHANGNWKYDTRGECADAIRGRSNAELCGGASAPSERAPG